MPDSHAMDWFLYGFLTGLGLVIIAILIMYRAAKWELYTTLRDTTRQHEDLAADLAGQIQKYRVENEALRAEIKTLRKRVGG
jgi:cell division protein FtsB